MLATDLSNENKRGLKLIVDDSYRCSGWRRQISVFLSLCLLIGVCLIFH